NSFHLLHLEYRFYEYKHEFNFYIYSQARKNCTINFVYPVSFYLTTLKINKKRQNSNYFTAKITKNAALVTKKTKHRLFFIDSCSHQFVYIFPIFFLIIPLHRM